MRHPFTILTALLFVPLSTATDTKPTISFLPTTINPLSLQAAVWGYVNNPLGLRADGCYINGQRNCSQACTNVTSIFSSGATFENCLAYPSISAALATANASSLDLAVSQYGVVPGDRNVSGAVISTITNCLHGKTRSALSLGCVLDKDGYCTGMQYAGCAEALQATNSTGIFPVNATDPMSSLTMQCMQSLCNAVAQNSQVSADIGGIGAWISYVIQITLTILCWLVADYFRLLHPWVLQYMKRKGIMTQKLHAANQKEMFTESMIDFHKCQCYFMSAILLAGIVATQNSGGLGAESLQDVFTNLVLLSILSIGGSLPVMFVHFKLRLLNHRSWYSFILASASMLLSAILLWAGGPHKTIEYSLIEPPSYNIQSCGPLDPTSLCLQGFQDTWQPGEGTTFGRTSALYTRLFTESYGAFSVALVLWVGLLIDNIWHIDAHFVRSVLRMQPATPQHIKSQRNRFGPNLWFNVSFGFLDLTICVGAMVIMSSYLKDLARFGIGSKEWSFGQIVAITIWAPPLVQYIYLQMHGVEGNRWHLPSTLRVTREVHLTTGDQTGSGRPPSGGYRDDEAQAPAHLNVDGYIRGRRRGDRGSDEDAFSVDLDDYRVPSQGPATGGRGTSRSDGTADVTKSGHVLRVRSVSRTPAEERKSFLG